MNTSSAHPNNMMTRGLCAGLVAIVAIGGFGGMDSVAQPVPGPGQLSPVPTPQPLDRQATVPEPKPAAKRAPMARAEPVSTAPTVDLDSVGEVITLGLGKARLLIVDEPISEVMVGEPSVADVQVTGQGRIFVLGEGVGSTNVYLLGQRGDVVREIEVRVNMDTAAIQSAVDGLLPEENIEVAAHGDTLFLRGAIRSASAGNQAVQIARRFVPDSINVVNMLSLIGSQQVILQVKVSEIRRTSIKNLGFDATISPTFGADRAFTATTSGIAKLTAAGMVSGTLTTGILGLPTINYRALERQGLVKTLAEPTLTAVSGETSHFLAGGEFPFPNGIDDNGNATFEFREFGVVLNFTPVVQSDGRINMQISTEISAIDTADNSATTIQNSTLRGLTTKRTETSVELPSGGSLMIAGLLQNNDGNTINGVPGLKDLPVLGALFRSVEFQNEQTELIIMVTAFLAKPIDEMPLASLPTDGFVPASDADVYLLGRLWRQYRKEEMPITEPGLGGPYGYIMR